MEIVNVDTSEAIQPTEKPYRHISVSRDKDDDLDGVRSTIAQ
jgi:hypothetical protein